jgi:hypothetical protein
MQPQSYEVPKFRIRSKWPNEYFNMQNKYFFFFLCVTAGQCGARPLVFGFRNHIYRHLVVFLWRGISSLQNVAYTRLIEKGCLRRQRSILMFGKCKGKKKKVKLSLLTGREVP